VFLKDDDEWAEYREKVKDYSILKIDTVRLVDSIDETTEVRSSILNPVTNLANFTHLIPVKTLAYRLYKNEKTYRSSSPSSDFRTNFTKDFKFKIQ
jgi:hypothetical protein